jgi:hypothetical protein
MLDGIDTVGDRQSLGRSLDQGTSARTHDREAVVTRNRSEFLTIESAGVFANDAGGQ